MRSIEKGRCTEGRRAHGRSGLRSGFTLIEIVIAMTIFGIVSIAVYSTFRVGLKSYESGREQMVVTQSVRVIFDLLTRDLRALYYLPPIEYNQSLVRFLMFREMQKAESPPLLGRPTIRERERRDRSDKEQTEKPPPGIPIDLTIVGVDREGGDSLTFVCYQAHWGTAPVEPWALARVRYFVENGNLFRAEGPVTVDTVPRFQWQPPPPPETADKRREPKPEEPPTAQDGDDYLEKAPRELVARDVKLFDLRYGYWTGEGWYESPDWIAHERRYRNPPRETDPLDPEAPLITQFYRNRPTDGVPAYVVVAVALGYGKDGLGARLSRTRIRLLTSLETYEPYVSPGARIGIGPPLDTTRRPPGSHTPVGNQPPPIQ